ncbi:plastid transcriptionally active 6 [Abeliophyllum distichum]|uniref:Plastid transcriptionally active 6 n=1 Tax=Abeliophyllum distichum TaxID=126358 RepID=A0ABD1STG7_9LAMI
MNTAALLLFPPPPPPPTKFSTLIPTPSPHQIHFPNPKFSIPGPINLTRHGNPRPDFRAWADDGDADGGDPDDYDMDEDEVEEVDNKKDFDVDYDTATALAAISASASGGGDEDIAMVHSKSFVSTQGWDSEKIVDYRINEDEFHKICLLDCDFFIRKPPDPDNDVYDFREMYVTPPDTDIYAVPKVLAPMPQKYIRCAQSDYGCYNVTEPPIDAPRDPMYKSEREVLKVFLTKHYRNRRLGDTEFTLDFEEIYVIDSKTKSITRAKVVVAVPGGRNRDRKNDLLVIRENGNSFKIITPGERDDPTTVIEKEEWNKTRQDMEKHLRKLRDFSVSNWF